MFVLSSASLSSPALRCTQFVWIFATFFLSVLLLLWLEHTVTQNEAAVCRPHPPAGHSQQHLHGGRCSPSGIEGHTLSIILPLIKHSLKAEMVHSIDERGWEMNGH